LKALEQRLVERCAAGRTISTPRSSSATARSARELFRVYERAFPAGYREEYPVESAVTDIEMIESLAPQPDLGMNLYAPQAEPDILRFKIYRRGSRVPLSDSLPMLERLGVRVFFEHPHKVEPADRPPVRVVDFGVVLPAGALPLEQCARAFPRGLPRHVPGDSRSGQPQPPVLTAGLDAREIRVLRAYARYLRQGTSTFSLAYVEQALVANARIAALLVRLFFTRFSENDRQKEEKLAAEIATALDAVQNLDEDRILRSFLAVIQATTRTNFFQGGKHIFPLNSIPSAFPACPSRGRCSRSGSTRPASRPCTCAAARWRAAASAGRTAWRTSAPRCWA